MIKIKYQFADGTINEIEVDDEYAWINTDMREFENSSRKYRYWARISLDQSDYEGEWFQDPTPNALEKRIQDEKVKEDLIKQKEYEEVAKDFYESLTETQRRRLKLRLDNPGMSLRDIAAHDGVDIRAITDCFNAIKKKYNKFFNK